MFLLVALLYKNVSLGNNVLNWKTNHYHQIINIFELIYFRQSKWSAPYLGADLLLLI